jgi:two-component system cell cycle sensor histidine kinase/response regulator CckA
MSDPVAHALGERIKELASLHRVAGLLHDDTLAISAVLDTVAGSLPAAFQFPEVACARIIDGAAEHRSPGFVETPWMLRTTRASGDGASLTIEVAYREERPPADEGPFLAEERHLLDSTTEMLRVAMGRRRAQERLSLAVQGTGAGVWEWDIASGRVSWSREMEAIAGLAPGTFPGTLEAVDRLVHPEDLERVRAAADQLLVEGSPLVSAEYRIVRPDGSVRWVSSSAQMVRATDGSPLRVLGLALDSTARHALEDQLRQAQKLDALGGMAAAIAHDFNNMLTVILSVTEMALLQSGAGESSRQDLVEIQKAGLRAADLTRQLLAFSRHQVLQPRIIDLDLVIRGVEGMIRRLLREDIEIVLLPGRATGRAFADPGQLEQALINLAVNARDAMPTGGRLTLATEDVELGAAYAARHPDVKPGRFVMLSVTDDGVGMTAAERARAFEPFFTTKGPGKGTGLGLATVFGIVRQSGGHVALYSEPGHGTTFRIYLPRVDRAAEPPAIEPPPSGDDRGDETILLVEDDAQVRSILATALRHGGYRVLEAANAGEAFLAAEQHPARIDLLATDVVMPRMSGHDLAARLAAVRPLMKVLYLSGHAGDEVARHGVAEPNIALVEKPLTPHTLLRAVRRVLDAGAARLPV